MTLLICLQYKDKLPILTFFPFFVLYLQFDILENELCCFLDNRWMRRLITLSYLYTVVYEAIASGWLARCSINTWKQGKKAIFAKSEGKKTQLDAFLKLTN